jgi:hypothetical protein
LPQRGNQTQRHSPLASSGGSPKSPQSLRSSPLANHSQRPSPFKIIDNAVEAVRKPRPPTSQADNNNHDESPKSHKPLGSSQPENHSQRPSPFKSIDDAVEAVRKPRPPTSQADNNNHDESPKSHKPLGSSQPANHNQRTSPFKSIDDAVEAVRKPRPPTSQADNNNHDESPKSHKPLGSWQPANHSQRTSPFKSIDDAVEAVRNPRPPPPQNDNNKHIGNSFVTSESSPLIPSAAQVARSRSSIIVRPWSEMSRPTESVSPLGLNCTSIVSQSDGEKPLRFPRSISSTPRKVVLQVDFTPMLDENKRFMTSAKLYRFSAMLSVFSMGCVLLRSAFHGKPLEQCHFRSQNFASAALEAVNLIKFGHSFYMNEQATSRMTHEGNAWMRHLMHRAQRLHIWSMVLVFLMVEDAGLFAILLTFLSGVHLTWVYDRLLRELHAREMWLRLFKSVTNVYGKSVDILLKQCYALEVGARMQPHDPSPPAFYFF